MAMLSRVIEGSQASAETADAHTVTGISSLPLRPWNPEPALEFPTPRLTRGGFRDKVT